MLLSLAKLGRNPYALLLLAGFTFLLITVSRTKYEAPPLSEAVDTTLPLDTTPGPTPPDVSQDGPVSKVELAEEQAIFWRSFYADLLSMRPDCDGIAHPEDTHLDVFYNPDVDRPRPDYLNMSDVQHAKLKHAHAEFVDMLQNGKHNLPYAQGTRGIVTTAGGAYLPVAVVSIRMLRRTGSTLPVEVFLASQLEWDADICDDVMPSLNAKCVVLQDVFTRAGTGVEIEKYQYKIMAVLFSSFEEILFLDSDAFPIFDPNDLFESEPFTTSGMVLWPDFWFASESPLFFDIAKISAPALNLHASTESGEILYSKAKHQRSIMLAAYYNYYGPSFYYPLQSQGAPGEGDKETFPWAATALGESYHFVRTGVSALGYTTKSGDWRGSAMLQYDPILDYQMTQPDRSQFKHTGASDGKPPATTRPFFIHANFPKFDPASIYDKESFGASGPTRDSDGRFRRVWHSTAKESVEKFGFDLEKRFWEEIVATGCEYEDKFNAWRGRMGVCERGKMYWKAVFGEDDRTENASG